MDETEYETDLSRMTRRIEEAWEARNRPACLIATQYVRGVTPDPADVAAFQEATAALDLVLDESRALRAQRDPSYDGYAGRADDCDPA